MSLVLDRYGIAGHTPRWRAATRFDLESLALITERGARIDIGADVEKRLEVAAVAGITTGEMKGNWHATEIGLQVNLDGSINGLFSAGRRSVETG
jgi:hypothetical protein